MDRIIVSTSELITKADELIRDGFANVEISYAPEDEMPDGDLLPASLRFTVWNDIINIDYEGVDSAVDYKDIEILADFEDIIVSTKELKEILKGIEKDNQKFIELAYYPLKDISKDEFTPASIRFLTFDPSVPDKRFDYGYLSAAYDD
ncbi:hypothetical protein [Carnobacterium maltaromaticum]|uniref:hypothetical protein n=1 Tax=Carnobacterium maltaromaticum TaxID=2751 RepID=UPI00114163DD|nr:hypothetical protein [Carnobacterium maltaromaticum]GED50440.1 hypothetical protein CMA01_28500 [Carnobacterium maltaromaticum]